MTENRAADLADCCTSKRAPGNSRGLLIVQQGCCLPADLEAGSAAGAATLGARDVTAGDKLDPQRIRALVVRGGARLAQRIEAVHRRTRGCGGESRQLEHHPRTGIEFRHAEGQVRPFRGDLVLGARSYVGCTVRSELLAIAAEHDWRPLRRRVTSDSTTAWGDSKGSRSSRRGTRATTSTSGPWGSCGSSGSSASRGTGTRTRRAGTAGSRSTATTAAAAATEPNGTTAAAHIHAPDIALAYCSVPGGLDLACVVDVDSGDVDDVGIGDTGDGDVLVIVHRGLVDGIAVVV